MNCCRTQLSAIELIKESRAAAIIRAAAPATRTRKELEMTSNVDMARFKTETVFGGPFVARRPSVIKEVVDTDWITSVVNQNFLIDPGTIRQMIDGIEVTERPLHGAVAQLQNQGLE